jgi:hypothetical protein
MTFVSPTLKIRCPYCRNTFHPGDCAVFSTSNPGKLLRKPPVQGSIEYARSRTWIEELTGPEFTTEMAVRQCPHCNQLLFEGIEVCDNINIAIIGDTFSGKTHYIAALIDQLKRSSLTQNGNGLVQLRHRNEYTNKTYRDVYYKPIIQDRTSAVANLRGRYDAQGNPLRSEPLVYQLVIQDNSTGANNMLNLLLYDLSGEDFADNITLVQFGEHVLRADGIIYLADPLSMAYIAQQMPPYVQPTVNTGRTAEEVLSAAMYRLEQYSRVRPGESIRIPTAIAVSKADLLQYVIPAQDRPNYWFMYRPAYDGKAHLDDIRHVDQEVRSILHRYGEHALLQLSKRFDEVNFFAISATGNAPDSTGRFARLEPHRCLDPFIWLLWKLRFLQAVRY